MFSKGDRYRITDTIKLSVENNIAKHDDGTNIY